MVELSRYLYKPSLAKRFLEIGRIRQVKPGDICHREILHELYGAYPQLLGDRGEIDVGFGGNCQSWNGNRGWWTRFIEDVKRNEQELNIVDLFPKERVVYESDL